MAGPSHGGTFIGGTFTSGTGAAPTAVAVVIPDVWVPQGEGPADEGPAGEGPAPESRFEQRTHAEYLPPMHTSSPRRITSICVFCGSTAGVDDRHADAARAIGTLLARHGVTLVYGGGRVGLMGAVADAALEDGGRVVGVMPRALWAREVGHTGLSELLVVDTMHERKALMADRADAFVALPGGAGTLEELFEVWTWAQLGIHAKPVAVLNANGFYDPLLGMVDHLVDEGFVRPAQRAMLIADEDPARLLARLEAYEAPAVTRWLTTDEA